MNTIEMDVRTFYDCDNVYGIDEKQKHYIDSLIELAPKKPNKVFIDLSRPNHYVFLRYGDFDYPIKLEFLGKYPIDQFLNNNVHALANIFKNG